MNLLPLYFLRTTMIGFIIHAALFLSLFISIIWSMTDEDVNNLTENVISLPQSLECSFLEKVMSLSFETKSIQNIDQHDLRLKFYKLSRQPFFDDLSNLCRIWILREKDISNSLKVTRTLISNYHSKLDRSEYRFHLCGLLIILDSLTSETVKILEIIHVNLDKLEKLISKLKLSRLTEQISAYFELPSSLKPPFKLASDHYTSQIDLVKALLSVSIVYKYLPLLESTFNELKHTINKKLTIETFYSNQVVVNPVCYMEREFEKIKELTKGILLSQDLYLSICSFIRYDFSKKHVNAYRSAQKRFGEYETALENVRIHREILENAKTDTKRARIAFLEVKKDHMKVEKFGLYTRVEKGYDAYVKTREAYNKALLAYEEAQENLRKRTPTKSAG